MDNTTAMLIVAELKRIADALEEKEISRSPERRSGGLLNKATEMQVDNLHVNTMQIGEGSEDILNSLSSLVAEE